MDKISVWTIRAEEIYREANQKNQAAKTILGTSTNHFIITYGDVFRTAVNSFISLNSINWLHLTACGAT